MAASLCYRNSSSSWKSFHIFSFHHEKVYVSTLKNSRNNFYLIKEPSWNNLLQHSFNSTHRWKDVSKVLVVQYALPIFKLFLWNLTEFCRWRAKVFKKNWENLNSEHLWKNCYKSNEINMLLEFPNPRSKSYSLSFAFFFQKRSFDDSKKPSRRTFKK